MLTTTSACFSHKVVSASKAVFCTMSAKFNPCALTSHSSHVGCVRDTGIFTFTSQRRSWPVVMSSRAEYSGYAVYPKSFRVSHKSTGKPPSSRQFKWVHACASTVMDPEADIWNKWQLSEPNASTCTRIDFHCYKRELHTKTTTKTFKPSTRFWWAQGISLILMWVTFAVAIHTRCKDMLELETSTHKTMA
jgi:hypothetical protein